VLLYGVSRAEAHQWICWCSTVISSHRGIVVEKDRDAEQRNATIQNLRIKRDYQNIAVQKTTINSKKVKSN
jgi:hypothetical protein